MIIANNFAMEYFWHREFNHHCYIWYTEVIINNINHTTITDIWRYVNNNDNGKCLDNHVMSQCQTVVKYITTVENNNKKFNNNQPAL